MYKKMNENDKLISSPCDVEELEKLFEVADKTHMGLLIRVAGCYGFRRRVK